MLVYSFYFQLFFTVFYSVFGVWGRGLHEFVKDYLCMSNEATSVFVLYYATRIRKLDCYLTY